MKLSIATLNVAFLSDETAIHTVHYLFLTIGSRTCGHTLNSINHIYVNEAAQWGHWDSLPSTLRAMVEDGHPIEQSINKYVDWDFSPERKREVSLRDVTAEEHKWFMTYGYGAHVARLFDRMTDRYFGGLHRTIARRVQTMLAAKYERDIEGRQYHVNPFKFRGFPVYHQTGYLTAHKFCKTIGALVRDAIKDDSADAFESAFMEDYETDNRLYERTFSKVSEVLRLNGVSLNLEQGYCDHIDYADEMTEVYVRGDYRNYCSHCRENEDVLVYTDDTNEYLRRSDAYYDDNNDVWLSEEPESDDPDDNDANTDSLMSYRTNVLDHLSKDHSFESSPFGDFHMGVELELIARGSVNGAVENIRAHLGEDYCICKTDGSLPGGGLEIVTAPRALTEHIETFKNWTIDSDYYAWNGGKCGMHIHMDSKAFTKLTLGKFIMFMNADSNADFIRKLAGRHPLRDEQARSYCAAEHQPAMENASKALKGKSMSRYYMVNTTCLRPSEADRLGVQHVGERNFNTIELRVFRASLKKARLLAQIEFTHAAVMFCRVASMRDLNEQGFLTWLKSTDNRYPHLADWYGIRRRAGAKNAAPVAATTADAE